MVKSRLPLRSVAVCGAVAMLVLMFASVLAPPVAERAHAQADLPEAVEEMRDSVVTVYTFRPGGTFAPGSTGRAPSGAGSGWAYGDDGLIVTNAHVVDDAEDINVVTTEGKLISAELVGADWYQDVAVLRMDPGRSGDHPPAVTIGTSAGVAPGQDVVAIGTPHGRYLDTVSDGQVLAIDQRINTGAGYSILHLIQHSATLAPGNSGGPLVATDGSVVGMNVASRAVGVEKEESVIGFAIAIDAVDPLVTEMVETGMVARPWLGVTTGLDDEGTLVREVESGSPADEAGIDSGDRIVTVGDTSVTTRMPFIDLLYQHDPGDDLVLTLERDGEEIEVRATLGGRDGS